jgi:CubicO group peptidase (beta-lactamase class C family)
MDSQVLARIPKVMQSSVDKGQIAGAVTLVARHGVVASLNTVGYRDLKTRTPMRTDTIFELMSMTKPFTGVAIMILVEEGKVVLNDPIEKYLPEFKNVQVRTTGSDGKPGALRKPVRPITVENLLTHTSGIPATPPAPYNRFETEVTTPLGKLVALTAQEPLEFDPGTHFEYSNMGIETAARIAEVASGMPFAEFLQTRVFAPLGMKDTFFFPPPDKHSRIASVYAMKDGKLVPTGETGDTRSWWGADSPASERWIYRKGAVNPMPEGGLYSTALDLFAFYQMVLNGGTLHGKRILSPASVGLMTTSLTGELPVLQDDGTGNGQGWGLSFTVNRGPKGGIILPLTSVGTFSHAGKFSCEGWGDRKRDIVGIYLIQQEPYTVEERNSFIAITEAAALE